MSFHHQSTIASIHTYEPPYLPNKVARQLWLVAFLGEVFFVGMLPLWVLGRQSCQCQEEGKMEHHWREISSFDPHGGELEMKWCLWKLVHFAFSWLTCQLSSLLKHKNYKFCHFILIALIWEAINIVMWASLKDIYTCGIKLVCVLNRYYGLTFYI